MVFPVEYSTLSAKALLELCLSRYSFPTNTIITFLKRGFNDTYQIEFNTRKFILRAYKSHWRTKASIKTELKVLSYLKDNGISVSFPIADIHGEFIQSIVAPEGERFLVLFSYAEGTAVRKLTVEQTKALGVQAGKFHK